VENPRGRGTAHASSASCASRADQCAEAGVVVSESDFRASIPASAPSNGSQNQNGQKHHDENKKWGNNHDVSPEKHLNWGIGGILTASREQVDCAGLFWWPWR